VRPARCKQVPDVGAGARRLGERGTPGLHQCRQIDPGDLAAERGARAQHPFEHRLQHRTQRHVVTGGHQVQRGAHHRGANSVAAGDHVLQLVGREGSEARPQADVRRVRLLGLHAGEVLDHPAGRQVCATQQQLPFQQCPG
jgi:hypothetical protein